MLDGPASYATERPAALAADAADAAPGPVDSVQCHCHHANGVKKTVLARGCSGLSLTRTRWRTRRTRKLAGSISHDTVMLHLSALPARFREKEGTVERWYLALDFTRVRILQMGAVETRRVPAQHGQMHSTKRMTNKTNTTMAVKFLPHTNHRHVLDSARTGPEGYPEYPDPQSGVS